MATVNVQDNRQVIDYMARDYASFRNALIGLIPAKLPEWTDRSEADFGIVMIELFAYMADILSYYQDRIANEAFLSTAQERRSVIQHLNLIGYELQSAAPATAHLSVIVSNTTNDILEIRPGDQFSTASTKDRRSVIFEYVGTKPLVIDLSKLAQDSAVKDDGVTVRTGFKEAVGAIPVREGKSVTNELVGVSDGTPNQTYPLAQPIRRDRHGFSRRSLFSVVPRIRRNNLPLYFSKGASLRRWRSAAARTGILRLLPMTTKLRRLFLAMGNTEKYLPLEREFLRAIAPEEER